MFPQRLEVLCIALEPAAPSRLQPWPSEHIPDSLYGAAHTQGEWLSHPLPPISLLSAERIQNPNEGCSAPVLGFGILKLHIAEFPGCSSPKGPEKLDAMQWGPGGRTEDTPNLDMLATFPAS